jgi:hypothetical protein
LYKPPSESGESLFAADAASEAGADDVFYEPGDLRWAQAIAVDEGEEEGSASDFIDFEQQGQNLQRMVNQTASAKAEQKQVSAPPRELPELTDELVPSGAELEREREASAPITTPTIAVGDASPLEALRLQIGVWIELRIKGQWTRAQLTWQSPRKTMFVFVSGSGTAHSMSSGTLEGMMSEGKVRLVSDKGVLDSAIDAAASATVRSAVQNAQKR